ncbi:MAG: PilX N-terminal domain-containing pilus assembly protein [Nitrospirae bacterium]|nr:PilX N-terminal domain-containing pilus assembly protein [Nitrospirota bacterium]MDA1303292.1 PilX N-terminal domain-containing pilus assembly protein [Nitrospirota bacterium]
MPSQRQTLKANLGKVQIQGFALVAALLLIVVVGIVAATVLQTTSTEIKISGNQRQAVQDFYAAEAGLAEGRARLRNRVGAELFFISDLGQSANPFWSSYILTSSTWKLQDDPNFSSQYLNLIPQPGNPTSTAVLRNSVQSSIPYWVKLRHKTEYDAEQAGHSTSTSHYFDGDGSTSKHQSPNVGNVVYFGYPNADANEPQQFTTQGPTPWLPVELVTSKGGSGTGGVLLETAVVHPVGPNHLGAVYAFGDIKLSGQSGTINGHDACGVVPSLSPVYSGSPISSGAGFQFDGGPAIPVQGSVVLDLAQAASLLSVGVVPIQSDLMNQHLSTNSAPDTYLLQGATQSPLVIKNVVGQGILLVDGDANLEGEISWQGMIIVTGDLLVQGDGAVITVNGGLWAKTITQVGGHLNIQYDSCQIKAALLTRPVEVMIWREVL